MSRTREADADERWRTAVVGVLYMAMALAVWFLGEGRSSAFFAGVMATHATKVMDAAIGDLTIADWQAHAKRKRRNRRLP